MMRYISWPADSYLRKTNSLLLAAIIIINGYILAAPLLPWISYEIKQHTKPLNIDPAQPSTLAKIDRSRNHLLLPTLQLDEPVYSGSRSDTIRKGIWHRPNASSPDEGGNTVLVGHRFSYNAPAVFYSLDKLREGDDVFLIYEKKIYRYVVDGSKIVTPLAIEVEAPSEEAKLTLYTCTPLWTAKDRLVYTARFVEVIQ